MKVRDVLALIESDGWVLVRTKGSHRQFQHPTKLGTVTIAGKPDAVSRQERPQRFEAKQA